MIKTPVKQENEMDCAVACVAFILNIDYQKALILFDKPKNAKNKGFLCKEICLALGKGGLNFNYKYIKTSKIKDLMRKNNSIVFLKRSKKYPRGHFLCGYKDLWMDSWINFPLSPIQAGFRKRLPGKPIYVISPSTFQ